MWDATSARQYHYHSNKYHAAAACEHCEGIIRHAFWCITLNSAVRYAYTAFLDASKLSQSDHLTLHALGVIWQDFKRKTAPCTGNCGITGNDPTTTASLVRLA